MHELYCPNCNTPSHYNFNDYLLLCQYCSATFSVDLATGNKEIYLDHFIVPNTTDPAAIKELALEWLRRIHHKPNAIESEFFVIEIKGYSIPYWCVSMEAHTAWTGLIKKQSRGKAFTNNNSEYLRETGQFRRSYRWAISGRSNICETWGFTRLHEPVEPIAIDWDGFPIDSTMSRGKLADEEHDLSAYEHRENFEFKFANGLPILGVQISEQEAMRRARSHVENYHHRLACLNVDFLMDYQTELEVAGIQLIHLPFWRVGYVYKPKTFLKYFYRTKEKFILIDGFGKGVLKAELSMQQTDKIAINAVICTVFSLIFFFLGAIWHPAFFIISLFGICVAMVSAFVGFKRYNQLSNEPKTSSVSLSSATTKSRIAS